MESKNITISFFFRRINDFDQYIHIIDYMNKKKYSIILVCLNENFQLENYNKINFYKKFSNIKIDHLNNFLLDKNIFLKIFFKIAKKFKLNRLMFHINSFILSYKNLNNFVKKNNIKVSIFDFPITNSNYLDLIGKLKKIGIKIFGIHHAIWVRDVNLKNERIEKIFLDAKKKSNNYDKILAFSNEYVEIMKKLGVKDKFFSFGILSQNLKKNSFKKMNNKTINILYIDHSSKHGINKLNVVNDLVKLKKISNIQITIRPNTSIEFVENKSDLEIFFKNGLGKNISYEETEDLIDKNDLIINPISSVILKAFLKEKIVIHPVHYIPDEKMVWQRFKACFEINSFNDLMNVIDSYKKFSLDLETYKKNCTEMLNFFVNKESHEIKLEKIKNEIIDLR